jgi:cytoskeleton protein RodZ
MDRRFVVTDLTCLNWYRIRQHRPATQAFPREGLLVSDDLTPAENGAAASLGAALVAARTARGMSVEDVVAATRIRATLVRAIENDDFSRCGGAAYARGHLKSIAQVVGADGRRLVEEFDRRHHQPVPSLVQSPLPTARRARELGRASRPKARWASMAIGVLVVVTVFLAVSWFAGRGQSGGPPVAASPGSSVNPTPATTRPTQAAPTEPKPTTVLPAPKGVRLLVAATSGASWLRVVSSKGDQLYQGILSSGQSQEFRDGEKLSVRFGNSPAVTLTVNGRLLGSPRCDTRVCDLDFTPKSVS